VRKSTEELDHLEIRAAITALRTAAFRIARHGAKQSDRAALVGEVLAVVERHIEEAAPHQRHEPVETAFERAVGYTARRRVGREGARRLAEDRDSGVRRGGDILIALCLGAQFVFFGRPTLYGAAGVKKAVDILRGEIDLVMGQIGCLRLDQLGPDFLWRDDWPRNI
jgi:hypothetical protein